MGEERAADQYITAVDVVWAFAVEGLRIDLENRPEQKRHLILTGPNGSGKSSILLGLYQTLSRHYPYNNYGAYRDLQRELSASYDVGDPVRANSMHGKASERLAQLRQHPLIGTEGVDSNHAKAEQAVVMLPANRILQQSPVSGARRIEWQEMRRKLQPLANWFGQHLVNRRFDQLIAREGGNTKLADEIAAWFAALQSKMREIFADEQLELVLEPGSYEYRLRFADEREASFDQLPDGFASVLHIWAEIMLHTRALELELGYEPSGFVLIDEPELHLHAAMQERVLSFLVELFPRLQFIVATHSPAIASSIDDAYVYDLRTKEGVLSSELRGIRYGNLYTSWFGIETDFDLHTTKLYRRFHELAADKPQPGSEAHTELGELARTLSERSHTLALDVWRSLGGDDD